MLMLTLATGRRTFSDHERHRSAEYWIAYRAEALAAAEAAGSPPDGLGTPWRAECAQRVALADAELIGLGLVN